MNERQVMAQGLQVNGGLNGSRHVGSFKTKIYRKGWSLDCVTSGRDINETYANTRKGVVAFFNFHIFDCGPMPCRFTA